MTYTIVQRVVEARGRRRVVRRRQRQRRVPRRHHHAHWHPAQLGQTTNILINIIIAVERPPAP